MIIRCGGCVQMLEFQDGHVPVGCKVAGEAAADLPLNSAQNRTKL